MENQIFYTFSTIPQVLAGAIALIGVFLLFKIQQINNELKGIATAVLLELDYHPSGKEKVTNKNYFLISRLDKAIERNDFKGIKKNIDEIVNILPTRSMREQATKLFETKDRIKQELIKDSKQALIWISLTIILSILVLPFAKCINTFFAVIIFILGILLFIISLTMTIYIVYKSL